jgi:hypothetical protein
MTMLWVRPEVQQDHMTDCPWREPDRSCHKLGGFDDSGFIANDLRLPGTQLVFGDREPDTHRTHTALASPVVKQERGAASCRKPILPRDLCPPSPTPTFHQHAAAFVAFHDKRILSVRPFDAAVVWGTCTRFCMSSWNATPHSARSQRPSQWASFPLADGNDTPSGHSPFLDSVAFQVGRPRPFSSNPPCPSQDSGAMYHACTQC